MTPAERAVERAKNADRQAIRRAIDTLKKSATWKNAPNSGKQQMESAKKEEVMNNRYA